MWENIDYILGIDRSRFKMMGIRSVRNYPSDYLVQRARLLFSPTKSGHKCDVGGGTSTSRNSERGKRRYWEVSDVCGSGCRTWDRRYSDQDIKVEMLNI